MVESVFRILTGSLRPIGQTRESLPQSFELCWKTLQSNLEVEQGSALQIVILVDAILLQLIAENQIVATPTRPYSPPFARNGGL